MINKLRNDNHEVIADVEYYVVLEHKTIYIQEITTYGSVNKNKGNASSLLYKIIEQFGDIHNWRYVGVSTEFAIPFWKKIGAKFGEENEKNGDCFFSLLSSDLLLYLKKRGNKDD